MTKIVQRRPEASIADVLAKAGGKQDSIRKSAVTMKVAEDEAGGDSLTIESLRPTDEQVEKINQFTRSPKTADDLLVFDTMSCNDMYDRDDEGFRRGCIDQFTALEAPYSFVGKSFMLDHEYKVRNQVGRIFDEDTTKQSIDGVDVNFLRHSVYMPNTPENAQMATNIDFGIHWAVSVGVVIESTACTICDSPMYNGWLTFCYENGHEKGLYYDPDSTETDSWGWAMPTTPDDPKAVKCMLDMYDPKDGYELSMVFLGAQYFAELSKQPDFKGVMKMASAKHVPIIGLSREEAKALPLPKEDERVAEARKQFEVSSIGDGDYEWVDGAGLKWVYDSQKSEVLCLGKTIDNNEEDDDGEEGIGGDGASPAGEVVRADGDEGEVHDDEPDEEGLGSVVGGEVAGSEDGGEVVGEVGAGSVDPTPPNITEGEDVDKAAVVAAAKQAGLPDSLIEQVEKAAGNGLSFLLSRQAALVTIGEKTISGKRADALHWYTVARMETGEKGVNTDTFSKMLDRLGDDVELLDDVIEQQKALAQAKFPKSVRRSSFEADPHDPDPRPKDVEVSEGPEMSESQKRMVSRIHR